MCPLALCYNRTSFSCWAGHEILSIQTQRILQFYNSEEVRYLKVQVIVIEGHSKSSGMIQTLPEHDRRHSDGHFLSAPKMCSVIWSLQKSHLTQICLVIWCFCKSQTTNSNISPAKHSQLDFYRVQVTPSMWVGQGQSGIKFCNILIFIQIHYKLVFVGWKSATNFCPFCALMDADCKSHPPWVGHGQCGQLEGGG